jgi:hypothetical protein
MIRVKEYINGREPRIITFDDTWTLQQVERYIQIELNDECSFVNRIEIL